ncbi:MAG: hypothetical protein ACOZB3_11280 [Calditrichota bacterium]
MDKDYGNSIIEMADGGYAIAGVCDYWGRGPFFCVFRIDGQGSLLWWWEYDSSSGSAESIQLTEDGGLIAVGNIYRNGASSDFFMAKLNSQGDSLWTRYYGGTGIEVPYSLQITRDGGCIMAGKTNSFGAGEFDVYVIRTDSLGDSLWARTYGESGNECAYDLQSTSDGGYIIAGDTDSRGAGQSDFYLIKIDSNGDTLWTRTYGGSGRDQVPSVQQTADGGYFLAGSTNSFGGGSFDMYVIKTGPDRMQVIDILYPLSSDQWVINSYNTVIWDGHGFDWPVSILLNREYPYGEWETLVPGTDNDGIEEIWITEPVSSHCRLSISAVGYSPSDISDDDFIITTQQGYLSLISQADPAAPIRAWNLDTIDCAFEYSQSFHMINLGHSQLSFQPLEPPSAAFSLQTNCIGSIVLQPGAMSACSLTLIFDPTADGFHSDTLLIQTDAVNAVDGYLRIPLSGYQVTTPAAPNVSISAVGSDIWLSWPPIMQSIGECSVVVTAYLICNSEELNGPYVYHGFTTDTHYVHSGVSQYLDRMYYRVIATSVPISLFQSLPANGSLTETELLSQLRTIH